MFHKAFTEFLINIFVLLCVIILIITLIIPKHKNFNSLIFCTLPLYKTKSSILSPKEVKSSKLSKLILLFHPCNRITYFNEKRNLSAYLNNRIVFHDEELFAAKVEFEGSPSRL